MILQMMEIQVGKLRSTYARGLAPMAADAAMTLGAQTQRWHYVYNISTGRQ